MVKIIFPIVMAFVTFNAAAQNLKISRPQEFQFVHCTPRTDSAASLVKHHVIDIRKSDSHVLYAQSAPAESKARQLSKLARVGGPLLANTLTDVDVSWISTTGLTFKLNIIDNGGYAMDGELISSSGKQQIRCVDVTVE